MRVALYDRTTLEAYTTIAVATFEGGVTRFGGVTVEALPVVPAGDICAKLNIDLVMVWLPKPSGFPERTYVAISRDTDTDAWLRYVFDPRTNAPREIPPQHRPYAVEAIRKALSMGEST